MRNSILVCQLLGFALCFGSECFQTRDGSTCDLNSLHFISERLRSVFEEIYEGAPVNLECIKQKSNDEEMNLAFSMLDDDDKSDDVDKSGALFELVRSKVMSCYDSEVFVKRLMVMYERMQDEAMKNCIESIVRSDSDAPKCLQLSDELYEKFSIAELFLDTSSIVRVKNLSYEAHKCIKQAGNKEKRLAAVLAVIVNENSGQNADEKMKSRRSFKNFYKNSLENLSKCFKNSGSHLDVASFLELNLIKIFDSVIRVNLSIAVIILILMILMLFGKFLESRDSYEELD